MKSAMTSHPSHVLTTPLIIPDGWRLLKGTERMKEGDRFPFVSSDDRKIVKWIPVLLPGLKASEATTLTIRKRRAARKPKELPVERNSDGSIKIPAGWRKFKGRKLTKRCMWPDAGRWAPTRLAGRRHFPESTYIVPKTKTARK
jgi:hypothetical protein